MVILGDLTRAQIEICDFIMVKEVGEHYLP